MKYETKQQVAHCRTCTCDIHRDSPIGHESRSGNRIAQEYQQSAQESGLEFAYALAVYEIAKDSGSEYAQSVAEALVTHYASRAGLSLSRERKSTSNYSGLAQALASTEQDYKNN
jgi:hypothetical protein